MLVRWAKAQNDRRRSFGALNGASPHQGISVIELPRVFLRGIMEQGQIRGKEHDRLCGCPKSAAQPRLFGHQPSRRLVLVPS
jgi:hypothetical protein